MLLVVYCSLFLFVVRCVCLLLFDACYLLCVVLVEFVVDRPLIVVSIV